MPINGILDNHGHGKAADFLQNNISEGCDVRIVSAYFSIYAYYALNKDLNSIGNLKFLFGESHYSAAELGHEQRQFAINLSDGASSIEMKMNNRATALECANWLEEKAEIKSISNRLLHGKLYHLENNSRDHAMLGSSNFTLNGLGIHENSNLELNLVVDSDRDRADLKDWFDGIWNDSTSVQDVKASVLEELRKIYSNHSPEFVYFKTLCEIFDTLQAGMAGFNDFEDSAVTDSKIWKTLFDFQKDGVKAAVQKMDMFDGCIIADSVGLGKTYSALAVIRYYELKNKSVLVLCPKKLRDNWTVYLAQNNSDLNPFLEDRFRYTVLSHTDLSRDSGVVDGVDLSALNWGNYDLVVIDESHNFRNNSRGKRDEDGNLIKKSRYERLMSDIIKAGGKTKVLLLSATPVNNDLKDLRNQIYFITENRDFAFTENLGIKSLKELLSSAQKVFTKWAQNADDKNVGKLMEQLPSGLFKLLDNLSIARSRQHIQKYYSSSLEQIGAFPKREKPQSIFSEIDSKGEFLSYDNVNQQIGRYQLAVFNPTRFLKKKYLHHYDDKIVKNFTQASREMFLVGMMKVNFLKRLESSIHSFAVTMERTIAKIEALEKTLNAYKSAKKSDNIDMSDYQNQFDFAIEDDDPAPSEVGGAKRFNLDHLKIDEWLEVLRMDRAKLDELRLHAQNVTPERDAKLNQLKRLIAAKLQNPSINNDGEPIRKIIIFTAFSDTASYLYQNIQEWAKSNHDAESALVVGGSSGCRSSFGKARFSEILANFSPRSKKRKLMQSMPQDGEIDILIATDCISEGQNLQDCDYLVNYDIHWNPVRIIQRFGRIDRIGSRNNSIQLINFWPTADLNKYINLKNRVEARMALVDLSATSEDNILIPEEVESLVSEDMKYRDKQLLRLKDEIIDLEEFSESLVLNDFTLEDFRRELSNFKAELKSDVENSPTGIFALVPPNPAYPVAKPGVIFCLKDKRDVQNADAVNPLQPFYLVYVMENGEIAYGFAQAKQILDVFRALCLGQKEAYDKLYKIFDKETDNGNNMEPYNELLRRSLDSITNQFSKRNIGNLLSRRDGKLAIEPDAKNVDNDFDLITWLIIKEGEEYRDGR